MTKTRTVLLMLLSVALLRAPLDRAMAALLPDVTVDPVPQCIAGMLAALVLLGVPAMLLRPWTSARLPRRSSWGWLLAVPAAALLTRAAMTTADAAWQSWLNLAPDAWPVPESVPMALLYIAALAVVPALAEEAFFRGALLTGLLDGSRRWTAVLVTALSFALMHGGLANLPSLLALSLLLTLLMLRTGRILAPMAAHFIYNLTALWQPEIPLWVAVLGGAGLLGVLCVQPKIAHPPMKRADGLIALAAVAMLTAVCIL